MAPDATGLPRLPPLYRLVALDQVGSTMQEAQRLAEEGAEEGTLLWAQVQTAGRGRLGRAWQSPRGNLYFTLILRPDCAAAEAGQISFIAALALGEAIGTVSPPIEVTYKWPNDVLLQGSKVAGILLESRAAPAEGLEYLLLGCGVNVAHFPADEAFSATSLYHEGVPEEVTPAELLEAFARHFLSRASRWVDEGFAPIRRAWLRHAAGLGEEIEVRLPRETLRGRFKDLDADGCLLLELEGRQERRITSGAVYLTRAGR